MTFRHSKKWYFYAKWIARISAWGFAIVPALIATVIAFPAVVTSDSNSTVSVLFIIGVIVAAVPLLRVVLLAIKNNTDIIPALVLTVVAVLFIAVQFAEPSTINGLTGISVTAAIGNLVSVVGFKLYKVWDDLYKNCGEIYGEVKTK